ncbi:hypothetical protein [Elizabethkingia miricola]|uniref:hypothetical protein n=3 Tax=Elizabethkingia miricola TaxID=172045 RepID=UPI00140E68EA|nr:hypothetical protein [Elizabethkingia miricola]NHQ68657.1 hypothetical protein [Elizabethkingia miricola]
MPKRYGIYKLIIKNLELLGFTVINICFDDENFQYKNIGEKIENFLRKTFLRDKDFKQKLKFRHQYDNVEKKIDSLKDIKAHYALIIRADLYPNSIIKKIKAKSEATYAYQWDGLDIFPKIKDKISLFSRFYVFDPKDMDYPDTTGITNFYFDNTILGTNTKNTPRDLYFIGVYIEERMDFIISFLEKINALNINALIEIYADNISAISKKHRHIPYIQYISEKQSFEQISEKMLDSKVLIDFVNPKHNGLSLRIFEALGHNKKLITTNKEERKYEFYDESNILIYDIHTNTEEIKKFFEKAYIPPVREITLRYSFKNWIENIINPAPLSKITLPTTDR